MDRLLRLLQIVLTCFWVAMAGQGVRSYLFMKDNLNSVDTLTVCLLWVAIIGCAIVPALVHVMISDHERCLAKHPQFFLFPKLNCRLKFLR